MKTWYPSRRCYSVVPTVPAGTSFARVRSCNQSQLSQKRFANLLPVRCTILRAAELLVETLTSILIFMSRRSSPSCKAQRESRSTPSNRDSSLLRAITCCVGSDLPKQSCTGSIERRSYSFEAQSVSVKAVIYVSSLCSGICQAERCA